jgi:hypothetical protein
MWRKGKFSTKPGKKHSKGKKASSLNRSLYMGTSDATTQRIKFHPHLNRYPKKQKRNPMRYPAQQLIQIASPDNITPIPTQRHWYVTHQVIITKITKPSQNKLAERETKKRKEIQGEHHLYEVPCPTTLGENNKKKNRNITHQKRPFNPHPASKHVIPDRQSRVTKLVTT